MERIVVTDAQHMSKTREGGTRVQHPAIVDDEHFAGAPHVVVCEQPAKQWLNVYPAKLGMPRKRRSELRTLLLGEVRTGL